MKMPEMYLCWEMGQAFSGPERIFRVVHTRTENGRTIPMREYFTDQAEVTKRIEWIEQQDGYELVAADEYLKQVAHSPAGDD